MQVKDCKFDKVCGDYDNKSAVCTKTASEFCTRYIEMNNLPWCFGKMNDPMVGTPCKSCDKDILSRCYNMSSYGKDETHAQSIIGEKD